MCIIYLCVIYSHYQLKLCLFLKVKCSDSDALQLVWHLLKS